ncbi:DegT/DnrJ/EryC1/StrS family aminotransferase [Paenibacillus sp.]|uniref:DegT/DnrJ/EryC1/StrS family aminotransferase n=1 Tax=Paenibacillus sp. TaxID=58172 RepID=UPI002D6D339E|nr:DegT/DnrJ/EryC1/StrS family aminotransferase [Paenibacillus sp.]HZG58431.1 DegT/DnrJ/EryC1/StrS family aminotransferase [Paenibacillus sp.]
MTEKLAIDGGAPVRNKPFAKWPIYGELEEKLLLEVLHSGKWGGTGRNTLARFEEAFAARHEAKHAVTVVNGTVAITIALMAAGVKPGDEVIVPSYTFIATATSALLFGAIPVFADVEEDTLLIDVDCVEALITPKTKAVVAVHMAGAPANLTRLRDLCARRGLALVEDGAQAVGASWEGRPVGAIGDIGTFSFQQSKNINSGEGGIMLTNRDDVAELAWSLTNVGRVRGGAWYQHEHVGWNLRMTELQGAILLGQMSRLDEQMRLRERHAALLTEMLEDVEGVRLMRYDPRMTAHAYHLYMFQIDRALAESRPGVKAEVLAKLQAEGIPASSGYVPLHRNEAMLKDIEAKTGEARTYDCPVTLRKCERQVVWLTQDMLLGDEADVHDIATAIRKVMKTVG